MKAEYVVGAFRAEEMGDDWVRYLRYDTWTDEFTSDIEEIAWNKMRRARNAQRRLQARKYNPYSKSNSPVKGATS